MYSLSICMILSLLKSAKKKPQKSIMFIYVKVYLFVKTI